MASRGRERPTNSPSDFPTVRAVAEMASLLGAEEIVVVDFDLDG